MIKELDLERYLKQFKDIEVGTLVPLIRYEKNLGLPQEYKIEEYITKLKNSKGLKSVKRLRLIGRLFKNCEKPKAKKLYKGNLIRQGLNFIYKDRELWIILKSNWPTSNKDLPINCVIKNNWVCYKVPKDYIGVWYKYGRGRINFTIIPKKIKLCKEFWGTIGILIGEKNKGRTIAISNTEPKVLNYLLNFFNKTKLIYRDLWKINISINSKGINNNLKDIISKKAKKYWKKQLKINNIEMLYWYDQFSTNLENNFGEINLHYYNESTNKIINYLIQYGKENVLKNKENTCALIKGLLAADGGTTEDSTGRLNSIGVASKFEEERIFYKDLLENLNLKAHLYNQHNVKIIDIQSYLLALEFDLFSLHPKRNKIFIKRLLCTLTIKSMCILLRKPLLIKDIVNILNLKDYRNLNKNFSKLIKWGYLTRKNTEKGFIYSINKKYRDLLYPLITDNGTNLHTLLPSPS